MPHNLRILTLSCTFPNPLQDKLGLFVLSRILRLADSASVMVVAPVAVIEYGNAGRRRMDWTCFPVQTRDSVEIYHPRWIYPPLLGVLNALFLFAQTGRLVRKLLRSRKIDIIDSHFAYPDGIVAAMFATVFRVPFSITLRGNEPMHAQFYFRGLAIRWAIRRATAVIAVSRRLADFAVSCGASPDRVSVIPNGVDVAVFHPRSTAGTREALGLSNASRIILSAGYLIERKGHDKVIRCLRELRLRGLDAELVIAGGTGGEGNAEPALHRLVQELDVASHVHFTGAVPPSKLAELMSVADVVCLASSREGWPNVVNEALACGAPVVATDIGGVPDMLPSEEYGIVVPVEDWQQLADALRRALEKPWDRARIAAWGAARSWEQVGIEVYEALSNAVQRHDEIYQGEEAVP